MSIGRTPCSAPVKQAQVRVHSSLDSTSPKESVPWQTKQPRGRGGAHVWMTASKCPFELCAAICDNKLATAKEELFASIDCGVIKYPA